MMHFDYVIIGASAAGIACANKIRDLDTVGSIAIITDEQELPYNRCLLADYLAKTRTLEQVTTRNHDFFQTRNITFLSNKKVVAIDDVRSNVTLANKETVSYKKLFIASGRSGWKLQIPGHDSQGVFQFYSLQDAQAIDMYCETYAVKKALIIGGGFSGVECADALAARGIEVTIIDIEQQVLPRHLHAMVADHMLKLMLKKNVSFSGGTTATRITKQTDRLEIVLSTGSAIHVDLVIMAVGGKLNTDFVQNTAIEHINGGIVVNEHQQTTVDNIYAGGDCSIVYDQVSRKKTLSMLWPDAVKQGMIAGACMTGQLKTYDGAALIIGSRIFETTFVTGGPITQPPLEARVDIKEGQDFVHVLLSENNKLIGFCLIGGLEQVGKLRKDLIDRAEIA